MKLSILLGRLLLIVLAIVCSTSCELFEEKQPEPVPEVVTITPQAITRLCPDHIGGDREFDGHGPDVRTTVTAEVINDREISVDIYLHAKETRSDETEAKGSWNNMVLWTAPAGKKIVEIISDSRSEAYYTDTNHDLDIPSVRGGNLVRRFEIMGDTGGNDVGNCTNDDVYLSIYFNSMQVKLIDS